ncbi:fimbria/pilus outer membrane usher protein [Pseudomonas sp. C2B4]|uniref:fimbria/pilus outer membrane usher protein n=1 Tax=Pseudomonas sp. C2B4 TaxID=2735270 RepID=UPI0015861E5B|nr:fimbria/pilus outer membrane usher protein [Pseudomonas sp. C2B4]NUU38979.1 fimbrial biogenesis outer membrane usher protein [Pseudomonas sp. C2B4]
MSVHGIAFAAEEEEAAPVTFNTSFIQGRGQPVDLKQFIEGNSVLPGTYRVDIYVNRNLSGRQDITFQQQDNGDVTPCLTLSMLRQYGVDLDKLVAEGTLSADADTGSCVDVKALIPEFSSEYEPNVLRLHLGVPQAMMSRLSRGYVDPALWDEGVTAAFTDYSLNASRRKNDYATTDSLAANFRTGLNIGPWRLRNESSYSKGSDTPGVFNSNRNYAQRDITSLRSQLTLGQTYSDSEIFDSVRYKGAQLSSDLGMLPDSERGYAPVIRGVANSNATVEVKQNGFNLYTTTVSSGPFELTDIYPSGSNGDLEIVITEADGEVRTFTQAFASLPILVRRGSWRYSLDVGQYDSLNDEGNSPFFSAGNLVYGLTDNTTTFGGLMFSDGFSAANLGVGFNTPAGAISVDGTQSNSTSQLGRNTGQSLRFLYSKTLNLTGTTFTLAGYRYSTEGYRTFSEHVDDNTRELNEQPKGRAKSRFNLSANQVLGDGYGSLYVSASDQTYWNLPGQTRTFQAGYSNYWKRANYSFDITHTKFADNQSAFSGQGSSRSSDTQATFSISFPLGDDGRAPRANFSAANDSSGTSSRANVSGYVAGRDDLNFSVGASRGVTGTYSGDAQVSAKTPYANLGAGYSQGDSYKSGNLSARGSVVAHAGGINFGQSVGETFVLAEVENTPGVQVGRYAGVKTGSNGYAVIPNAQPYRGNFVNLNTQDLGAEIELESTSQQVIPRRGSITRATFKAKSGMRLEATFNYLNGKVPFGAVVEDESGLQLAVVDPRQTALLLVEKTEGTLRVKWADQSCTAQYVMSEKVAGENYQSKVLSCQ